MTTAPDAPAPAVDDLGLDREFLLKMASWPVIAVGFTLLAFLGHHVNQYVPVALLCLGMIVAAVIDGLAFKVPNWLTMPLILSGWAIGALHSFGVTIGPGPIDLSPLGSNPTVEAIQQFKLVGGIGSSLLCTAIAFAMIVPALFMGGMGQGDVKMQMGFGAWVGAIYGGNEGAWTVALAVCCGMIAGGVIAIVMMLLRGELHKNAKNFGEIFMDFKVLALAGPKYASERARSRRPAWHRLPYGIPLCIGFVGYLAYVYATV